MATTIQDRSEMTTPDRYTSLSQVLRELSAPDADVKAIAKANAKMTGLEDAIRIFSAEVSWADVGAAELQRIGWTSSDSSNVGGLKANVGKLSRFQAGGQYHGLDLKRTQRAFMMFLASMAPIDANYVMEAFLKKEPMIPKKVASKLGIKL